MSENSKKKKEKEVYFNHFNDTINKPKTVKKIQKKSGKRKCKPRTERTSHTHKGYEISACSPKHIKSRRLKNYIGEKVRRLQTKTNILQRWQYRDGQAGMPDE